MKKNKKKKINFFFFKNKMLTETNVLKKNNKRVYQTMQCIVKLTEIKEPNFENFKFNTDPFYH